MTNILFLNPTQLPKAVVYKLVRHLPQGEFNGVVLQSRGITQGKPTSERELFSSGAINGFEIINFPCFFVPGINYTLPLFHKQLEIFTEILESQEIDIIQVADYFYPTSVIPIFVKRKYNIPSVLTVNALPGYSWYFGDFLVDSTAKIYTHSLGRQILHSYDKVVGLYKKICTDIEALGVPKNRISLIPNGVDFELFEGNASSNVLKEELSIGDDEKVLLFVGRLARVKRVDILIEATKMLLRKGLKVKTIVVGDGPMREYYEKLSSSLQDSVIFTGYIPKNQLHFFYKVADVVVLPSLSEGLPNVLLEGSAAGKPCVASCINGIPDIIKHKKTGFLIKNPTPRSFYHFLKILLVDESLARKMGENGKEYVEENFNWASVVGKYIDLYKKILDAHS